ncbi:HAMP domain-containing sensor histidine kinase [Ahrensia sp. R2A130]|uniref:sensor histidine kinase n=1 Tax=Ahrensia sp. R2A130 TaxID=744979 RepID=UPI0001E0E8D6|nr:HAMP domain-containing sensor histidine kinase [Ahrensia sp. R2A130]EFL88980.1 integral membrane sensor signal transduction histidine kinase [Ahrensia sp. R2A130]
MFKSTAARLTVVYTVIFGLLAAGIVAYISTNTSQLLLGQFRTAIEEEVSNLDRMSRRGGLAQLIRLIENRARQPGANLYLVADRSGRIVAGNVAQIDRALLAQDGWRTEPFPYIALGSDSTARLAVARIFTLPQGLRLLVGRDTADAEKFSHIIFQAAVIALSIMVVTGIGLWFFIGRRGLKHIERVARTSQRISAGDLSQRLPLSGSGDEFDQLAGILNALISRIEKLNSGVTEMSDAIAHDLRTPLTRLRSLADVRAHSEDADDQAAWLEIVEQSDTMIATFDALLMISQVEAGAKPAEFTTVDLSAVAVDVFELYEPSAEDVGVQLEIDTNGPVEVLGNRALLNQVLVNLLDNAMKYGADASNPVVTISMQRQGQEAVLCVQDNGVGVPSKYKERVFDRMVRLDSSRTEAGSGLGLSLVRAIAGLHGGKVVLDDGEPGLIARISLPLS